MTPIGFIGLGIMGTPMAGHLAAAGYPLTIHDIDPSATARFAADHPAATVGVDTADVGRQVDVVVTMLPDGEQVQRVALGPDGLADSLAAGSLLVDCSSAQPWLTRETAAALAARGIATIDAPVSGAQWGAEQAELVFMVGGASADVARARPVLDVLGRAVFHVGPLGSGHIMKCINNTITAMTLLATAEGLVLGTRAGLDPAAINAVLNESTGGSWITRNHIEPRVLSRTFDDPFKLELMLKDVRIAAELARDLELDLPYAAVAETMYHEANLHAGPGQSLSELVRWVEHLSGVEITPAGDVSTDRI
jgi:3-hydroxyisobutyrate dehydrogenase